MMHLRGCDCRRCMPRWKVNERADKMKQQKREQNARAYMKRKLKGAAG